jgi:hypothetical protein
MYRLSLTAWKIVVYALLVQLSLPFIGGAYYGQCGDRGPEQWYLDRCIAHLRVLRDRCHEPDLHGVLDYTIRRYNRIGAWDVMVIPLSGPAFTRYKTIGCNCPWCPGITLDPCVLEFPVHDGAMVLVHEALHDYWPCFGHAHVDPMMERIEKL